MTTTSEYATFRLVTLDGELINERRMGEEQAYQQLDSVGPGEVGQVIAASGHICAERWTYPTENGGQA